MKYRILIKTRPEGKKAYYVQMRYLFFFWRSVRHVTDRTGHSETMKFNTLKEAEQSLRLKLIAEHAKQKSKNRRVLVPISEQYFVKEAS